MHPATAKDLTPVAMADMLDQDAENGNYHDFVGCHVKLAALLRKKIGEKAAIDVMRRLVDCGGLHGMNCK